MRAPDFWTRDGAPARLLAPLGWAVAGAAALRRAASRPAKAAVPVVCVGNLVAGGQGKTPVALALAAMLQARGQHPVFLTRGYGGRQSGPLLVDGARHAADEIGDEAVLLARLAPTVVAHDRPAGAALAVAAGADIIVMDDGFQNPSLAKDLAVIVVDGAYGFGNGRLLPAGPLREPVATGLGRADAVVLLGADAAGIAARLPRDMTVLRARLVPTAPDAVRGRRVLAFAGIGRPEKFFATLVESGADVVARHAFADHQPYDAAMIAALLAEARRADAVAVTTEKDHVRVPAVLRAEIIAVPVQLAWDDPAAFAALLDRVAR